MWFCLNQNVVVMCIAYQLAPEAPGSTGVLNILLQCNMSETSIDRSTLHGNKTHVTRVTARTIVIAPMHVAGRSDYPIATPYS